MPRRHPPLYRRLPHLGALGLDAAACALPLPGEEDARRMAITVDDLPVAPPARHTTAQREGITGRLPAALAADDAPAVGFVSGFELSSPGSLSNGLRHVLEAA